MTVECRTPRASSRCASRSAHQKTRVLQYERQRASWLHTPKFVPIFHARSFMTRVSKVCSALVTMDVSIWSKVHRLQAHQPGRYRASGSKSQADKSMRRSGRPSEHTTAGHRPLHWNPLSRGNNCCNPAMAADRINGGSLEWCNEDACARSRRFNHPALHQRRLAAVCLPL